eukprot:g9110.t1
MLILPPSDRTAAKKPLVGTTDQLLQVFALLRDFQFRFLTISRQDVFVNFEHFMDQLQIMEPPAGKVLGSWASMGTAWRTEGVQWPPLLQFMHANVRGLRRCRWPSLRDRLRRRSCFAASRGALCRLLLTWLWLSQRPSRSAEIAFSQLDDHFFVLPRDIFTLISAPEVISRLAVTGYHQVFGDLSVLSAGISSWMHAYAVERSPLPSTLRHGPLVCTSRSVTLHPVSPEELEGLFNFPGTHFGTHEGPWAAVGHVEVFGIVFGP